MTTLAIDRFELREQEETTLPVGTVCWLAYAPEGMRLNHEPVDNAIEHTTAGCNGIIVYVNAKFIAFELPAPTEIDEIVGKAHIKAIIEGILAGIIDHIACTDTALFIEARVTNPVDEHLGILRSLS